MLRTQISLTEDDRRLLDAEAARTGRSISALIRDAITRTYGGADAAHDLRNMEAAFGAWADRMEDGEQYVERLRSTDRLDWVLDS